MSLERYRTTQDLFSTAGPALRADSVSEGSHAAGSSLKTTLLRNSTQIWAVAALVLFGYFALAQLSNWPNRFRYPGEEDAAEGTQLSEMVHLRRGIQIYRIPSGGNFESAIYGPLSYLVGAVVINSDTPAYLPLRIISFVATLSLVIACYAFVRKLTEKRIAGFLAALLLFASAFIARYGISARADMVALLLSFLGFLVFYKYRENNRALAISAAFILLSFFYKQQFIGAPAGILLFLLISKSFRRALLFAGMLLGGGLFLLACFSFLVFPHHAFLQHFLGYNRLPFDRSVILPEILMFVIPLFVPLLGSADFLDRYPNKLLACYAGMASASYFLLLFSSGSGADTNRCLEATVILTCLLGARIATAEGRVATLAWTGTTVLTLGLVALLGSAFVVPRISAEDFAADRALQKYLRENFSPGTSVLGYYPADPLRAGLDAPITNLWHYSALIRQGALSDHDVVSRIDRGGYGAILLDFDLGKSAPKMANFYTTQSMRDAISRSYVQTGRLKMPAPEFTRYTDGNIYVWTPRPDSSAGVTTQ